MSRLIAIEGIDGSGKGTQAGLLCRRLQGQGVSCQLLSFPRYSETLFGQIAGEFLNGRFGSLEQVHPLMAALIFAGDRAESHDLLRQALANNAVVVLDRYVASNVAHQAAKRTGVERAELISRIERIEYQINGLPRPDLTLLLDIPVAEAQSLIARKAPRGYTTASADLQEADAAYLSSVQDVYRQLSAATGWHTVSARGATGLRTVDDIAEEIFAHASRHRL